MISNIREVRRSLGLTLEEVGERCVPPTTAQTIGRLETGSRTVSVVWLNRIAAAMGVEAGDLVSMPKRNEVQVVAILGTDGLSEPRYQVAIRTPNPPEDGVALLVDSAIGEYRVGDEIWCERLAPDDFANALNRDVLIPRPNGRFVFGRMIGREGKRLQLLPLEAGGKQQIFGDPAWIGVASRLIRGL